MKHRNAALLVAAVVALAVPAVAGPASAQPVPVGGPSAAAVHASPILGGVVPIRKEAGAAGTRTTNLAYHRGKIMTTAHVHPIFWGTSWATDSAVGDKISGISSFYSGWNASAYARTNTEYTDTVGGGHTVGAGSSADTPVVDLTQAVGGSQTAPILTEVAKLIHTSGVTLEQDGNGYYPVYTDLPRGAAGFCAWHSFGTVDNVVVQFAFFFRLDGDAGCDPGDPTTVHSQGLEAIANVSAHELSEALTDPMLNAWFDSRGAENGDKCAWSFSTTRQTFSDASTWMLQGEWSNGRSGCIWQA